MPLEIQHAMLRELFKVMRNSVSTAFPFFQKMPQSTPESSTETVQANTVSHVEKVFADTQPLVDLSESTESVQKLHYSAQSVMSEHKGASENEDAFGIIPANNSVKMIVCDGVSNNWASGIVARSFVELARQKDFWKFEDINDSDVQKLQNAWIEVVEAGHHSEYALQNKAGATSFNQVEIIYDQEKKQYTARAWILGNGGFLILNKDKSPRIICNGEDSLVSSLGQGFVVGKDKFKIGKPSSEDINWDWHEENIPLEPGDICYLMSDGIANAFLQFSRQELPDERLFRDLTEDDLRQMQHEGINKGWIEDDDATFVRVVVGER